MTARVTAARREASLERGATETTRRETILDVLIRAQSALPTREISRRTSEDSATVAKTLRSLCDLGLVRLDRDGRYISTVPLGGNALASRERPTGARTTNSAASAEEAERLLDLILSAEKRYRHARNPETGRGAPNPAGSKSSTTQHNDSTMGLPSLMGSTRYGR